MIGLKAFLMVVSAQQLIAPHRFSEKGCTDDSFLSKDGRLFP